MAKLPAKERKKVARSADPKKAAKEVLAAEAAAQAEQDRLKAEEEAKAAKLAEDDIIEIEGEEGFRLREAQVIADLANQVQDEDPAIVWEVLTSMPADELQRLLVFALAAIPTDQTVDQMFAWVRQLPVARAHEAVSA